MGYNILVSVRLPDGSVMNLPLVYGCADNMKHTTIKDNLVECDTLEGCEAFVRRTLTPMYLSVEEVKQSHNHFGDVFSPDTCPACKESAMVF